MNFLLEAASEAAKGGRTRTFGESLGDAGMGILIVFIGLICLIVLVAVLGKISESLLNSTPEKPASKPAAPVAVSAAAPVIENRDELVVAFSAAVAEELGTDVSAIRVVSFKEIG